MERELSHKTYPLQSTHQEPSHRHPPERHEGRNEERQEAPHRPFGRATALALFLGMRPFLHNDIENRRHSLILISRI